MLKPRKYEIALGFLVATALWAGVFVWQSSGLLSYEEPKATSESKKAGDQLEKNCSTFSCVVFAPIGHFIHEYRDEITASSTVIIAIFTAILGIFTVSVAGSTRIAARAAKASSDAAIAIELAIIRAEVGKLSYGTNQQGIGGLRHTCSVHELFFSNLGRTKAFPVEVQFGWTVGNKLPTTPAYPFTKIFQVNAIFEPDNNLKEVPLIEYEFEVSADIYDLLRTDSVNL